MTSVITSDEWRERSRGGELCGIMGCLESVSWQCLTCENHYCPGHQALHAQVGHLRPAPVEDPDVES